MGDKLNPKVVKYFFTAILSAIASILIVFVTSFFSSKVMGVYRNNHFNTMKLVADGYAKVADEKLNSYSSILNAVYDEDVFSKGSTLDIIYHLTQNKYRLPAECLDLFYFDEKGIANDINGNSHSIAERDYYQAIIYSGAKSFITGAQGIKIDGSNAFIMVKPVYSTSGQVKGGVGCIVDLYKFEELFHDINVLGIGAISIIDKYGKFVIHEDHDLIGTTYIPVDERFKNYSSVNIAKSKSGVALLEDENGTSFSLFYSLIPSSGWVLTFALPSNIKKMEKERNLLNLIMIISSTAILFILFFGEMMTIDLFQKKALLFVDFDPVTGLWSQDRFVHEADKLIRRRENQKYMLIDSDVMGYRYIGQKHGDTELKSLLKFIGKEVSKTSELYQGICCHGSSDHFYMFFKISSVKNGMKMFKTHALNELSITDSYKIPFVLKFGIAFVLPEDKYKNLSVSTLIGQASIAQKNIRKDSEIFYSIYDSKFLRRVQDEYFLESQAEKALKNREFFVQYQPKVNIKTEKLCGAEALVRWNHPERGIIPPNDFIPLFERTGFVTKVDFFVYEEVLKFLDARIKAGLPVVPVSVNMSRNHNKPEKFISDFMAVFNKYNVPAKYIQVEILERSFTENTILAEITNRLHDHGFTVAMDDFGTGESSLSMLTQVPIDVLKFDRSFLLSATNSHGEIERRSAGFIESFIGLGKRLEKETVFEGVETESQRDFLRVIDCDCVQGYFYSKPLSQTDFENYIKLHV